MRLTLAAALPILARYAVQGSCQTDPRVIEKINEARERLMQRPQMWKNKVQRFLFCASKACVTLPREIETVEAATVCNRPMKMRSKWYDVLDSGPGSSGLCGGDAVIDRGDGYVTFADFDEPRNVKVYADVPEVSTARMLLQGFDENGNRVRTWDDRNSEYVDGEYVAISNETPAVSVTVFSVLDGIQKPETNGYVRVYAFTVGAAATPATDITTFTNWAGASPAPGTIEWTGELLSFEWLGPVESTHVIAHLTYESGEVEIAFFDTNGNEIEDVTFDSWNWTPATAAEATPYLGAVIPGTAIPVTPASFTIVVSAVTWADGAERTAHIFFYANGEDDGEGTLYVLDSLNNVIAEEVVTVPFGTSWTWNPIGGLPFTSITFTSESGATNMQGLFNMPETYAVTLTQTNYGTFTFLTYNDDSSLDWDLQFALSEVLDPGLWSTGFYAIDVNRVYTEAVATAPDYLSLLAIQHPDETNPSYRRYEVPALRRCTDETAPDQQVIIMAKLRYLPVKRSTDFLVIENIGALKQMLLAINAEEKNEFDLAQKLEAKAEKILSDELQNHVGDAATNNQPMQVQQDCWAAGDIPCIL